MKMNVDKAKHDRMVRDVLMLFNESAVHPAELVLALGEVVGRIINQVDGSGQAKTELVNIAVKQMAAAIDAKQPRIITN
jgi:hypothetical protein